MSPRAPRAAPRRIVRGPAAGLAGCALLVGCSIDNPRGSDSLLTVLAPPAPAEAADMALDREDSDRRLRGTLLLANAPWGGDDIYLTMYRDYIADEEPAIRAAATRALGNHGLVQDAPIIAGMLSDPSPIVRVEAARALQRIHNPAVIPAMLARLDDDIEPEADIRAELAHGLGQYAEFSVVQALIGALADRQLRVTHASRESLRTLTGQDFGFDRGEWTRWASAAEDPFAARSAYVYPVFDRPRRLWEYLPFVPPPPNEQESTPLGLPRDLSRSTSS